MLSIIATAALLGFALALPQHSTCGVGHYVQYGVGTPIPCASSVASGSVVATSTSYAAPSSAQTPFSFPLANGFPVKMGNPAIEKIEELARGTLPDGALPTTLAAADVTTFQSIAFNEIFEVAFFTSLVQNITSNVQGFEVSDRDFILETLTAVIAQEELHYLGANGILKSAGAEQIQPCQYIFPSWTFDSAIDFARTFTEVVLGTLQDAQYGLAINGDAELIPLLGSVIGTEAEQTGYYRSILELIPNELPFLTRSFGAYLYSYLNQLVVVPGSCPNANIIALPIYGRLFVNAGPYNNGQDLAPKDQQLEFSFTNNGTDTGSIALVYISQQNLPIVEPLVNVQTSGDQVTFTADFPYAEKELNGLTIAVVTNGQGPFASTQDVADATIFGPGVITVN